MERECIAAAGGKFLLKISQGSFVDLELIARHPCPGSIAAALTGSPTHLVGHGSLTVMPQLPQLPGNGRRFVTLIFPGRKTP
jgi:hypothetical protein